MSSEFVKGYLRRYVILIPLKEVKYIPALLAVVDILADSLACMVERDARLIDMTVALCNVVDLLVAHSGLSENIGVDSEVGDGIVGHNYIRGNISGHSAATFHKHVVAYFVSLVYE